MRPACASVLLCAAAGAEAGTFVTRVHDLGARHLRSLTDLPCRACGKEDGKVDMWDPDALMANQVLDHTRLSVDVRGGEELRQWLRAHNLPHTTGVEDFEALVANETRRLGAARPPKDDFFADYRRHADIVTKMREWAQQYGRRAAAEMFSVGQTYEGRSIDGIRFGASAANHAIWVQCGIHAREWIAPASCMYWTEKLLQGAGGTGEVADLLRKVVIYVVPVLNVDGYEFSHTHDRNWRKNRQPNPGSNAVGTDINRNYEEGWDMPSGCGSSTSPSSDTYRGSAPWSTPEAAAVRDYVARLRSEGVSILSAHDMHSYSQLILRPWGDKPARPANDEWVGRIGDGMHDVIREYDGRAYTSQTAWDLYCVAGSAVDWGHPITTLSNSYTIELRPANILGGGFILPPAQIAPTGEEIYAAMVYYLREVTAEAARLLGV